MNDVFIKCFNSFIMDVAGLVSNISDICNKFVNPAKNFPAEYSKLKAKFENLQKLDDKDLNNIAENMEECVYSYKACLYNNYCKLAADELGILELFERIENLGAKLKLEPSPVNYREPVDLFEQYDL